MYNWAANEPVPSGSNEYRAALGLQDKVVYFYGGNIGHAQDMMNIVRLAIAMRNEDKAYFVLVGAGDEVELVRAAITEQQLSNMSLRTSMGANAKQLLSDVFSVQAAANSILNTLPPHRQDYN